MPHFLGCGVALRGYIPFNSHEDTWICFLCCFYGLYHGTLPLNHNFRNIFVSKNPSHVCDRVQIPIISNLKGDGHEPNGTGLHIH